MPLKRSLLQSLMSPTVRKLFRPALADAMPIFMLHRFAHPDLGVFGHSPENLRRNLDHLRRDGFRFVSLPDLSTSDVNAASNKSMDIAFTLDDGHSDFFSVGLPIFAEFDCPVTVFVSTGVIDREHWYWWDMVTFMFSQSKQRHLSIVLQRTQLTFTLASEAERSRAGDQLIEALKLVSESERLMALNELRMKLEVDVPAAPTQAYAAMTWAEMERCASSGVVTFGPHTISHPSLPTTSDEQAKREIDRSWERLKEKCSAHVPIFAYPFGAHSGRDVQLVHDSGLRGAVTTEPRYASRRPFDDTDMAARFTVPRFAYPDDSLEFLQVAVGFERVKMAFRGGREGWRTETRGAT
jgi:peptidoglycan/xylan/chitin deacetylase (PgdA/CDA1 family)